jgi:hypothetical protein
MSNEAKQTPAGVDWGAVLADHADHIHPMEIVESLGEARLRYSEQRGALKPVEWIAMVGYLDVVMWERRRLRITTWRIPVTQEQAPDIIDWVGELGRDVGKHWSTEPQTFTPVDQG